MSTAKVGPVGIPVVAPIGIAERCSGGSAAPRTMLEGLHASQAGTGRHKCPICAWKEGFEAGQQYALRQLAALETSPARAEQ